MGLGIVLVSFIAGWDRDAGDHDHFTLFGWSLEPQGATDVALYVLGIVGEVLMLTSIYLVMPVVRVQVSSRAHRRDNRNGFMGDHPPGVDLVLRGRIHG